MESLRFGHFEIRADERVLLVDGRAASIGSRAFDLLVCLVRRRERVVGRDELLAEVWPGLVVEESNLTVHVAALRKLLGARAIATVAGRGYRFTAAPEAATAAPDVARDVTALQTPADHPSIAVLPFSNTAGDPEQEYFVDGMVDDLITALSRVRAFLVIARASSFTYKGRPVDARTVGRELGVRYVVCGGVRRSGSRVRVTAQLVEAESGRQVWGGRFEGQLDDVFTLQEQVAAQLVAAIEPNLILAEAERTRTKPTENLHAWDLCLRALQHLNNSASREEAELAIALLDRAIALDPGYAYAKALSCWAHTMAKVNLWISLRQAQRVLPLALEAVVGHRDDPTTLAFAGQTLAFLGRRHEQGLRALERALELNPNSMAALRSSGWVRAYVGDAEVAIEHFERANRLNPVDPEIGYVLSGLGFALLMAGRADEAIAIARKALADAPAFVPSRWVLLYGLAQVGRDDEARAMAQQLLHHQPRLRVATILANNPFVQPQFVEVQRRALEASGIPP